MPIDLPNLAFAVTYKHWAEQLTAPFAIEALRVAALEPRGTIVDVAAGPGALAVPAASAGHAVLALDVAPGMVARLERKLAPYTDCAARVANCTALPCADDTQDAAFSIFGVANLPVWRVGIAEMVRVTRPGGIVVLGAWPGATGARPMAVIREVFDHLFPDREFWPYTPLPAWTIDKLGKSLADAGCADVAVHRVECAYLKPDAATLVADTMPFFHTVPGIAALSSSEQHQLEVAFAAALYPYASADGAICLPVVALIGVGRVA